MPTPRKIPEGISRAEYRHTLKHLTGGIRNKQKPGNPSMQHWPHPTDPKDPAGMLSSAVITTAAAISAPSTIARWPPSPPNTPTPANRN